MQRFRDGVVREMDIEGRSNARKFRAAQSRTLAGWVPRFSGPDNTRQAPKTDPSNDCSPCRPGEQSGDVRAAMNRQRDHRPRWDGAHGCGVVNVRRCEPIACHAKASIDAGFRRRPGHEAAVHPRAIPWPAVGRNSPSSGRRGRRRIASRAHGEAIVGWVDFWGLTCVVWPQNPGHPSRKRPCLRRPELHAPLTTDGPCY